MSTDEYCADELHLSRHGLRCPSSASRARSCARRWCSCQCSPAAPRASSSRCSNISPSRSCSCVIAPSPPSAYAVYAHLFQRYACTCAAGPPRHISARHLSRGTLLTSQNRKTIFLGSRFGICCTQSIRIRSSSWSSWTERRFCDASREEEVMTSNDFDTVLVTLERTHCPVLENLFNADRLS